MTLTFISLKLYSCRRPAVHSQNVTQLMNIPTCLSLQWVRKSGKGQMSLMEIALRCFLVKEYTHEGILLKIFVYFKSFRYLKLNFESKHLRGGVQMRRSEIFQVRKFLSINARLHKWKKGNFNKKKWAENFIPLLLRFMSFYFSQRVDSDAVCSSSSLSL